MTLMKKMKQCNYLLIIFIMKLKNKKMILYKNYNQHNKLKLNKIQMSKKIQVFLYIRPKKALLRVQLNIRLKKALLQKIKMKTFKKKI